MSTGVSAKRPFEISNNVVLEINANSQSESIGSKVPTLYDLNGSNNMTQSNTTRQANLVADASGYKALQFNATDSQFYLSANTYVQNTVLTYVIAVMFDFSGSGLPAFSGLLTRNNSAVTGGDDAVFATVASLNLRTNSFDSTGIITNSNVFSSLSKIVIAYTRSSDGTCKIYVNGKLLVSQLLTPSLSSNNVAYRFSGNPNNPSQRLFVGNLYNATIIHEDLSLQKLQQLIRASAFNAGVKF